jgi:hypothetical protein
VWLCGRLNIHLEILVMTMKKLFLTLFTMPTVVGAFLPLAIHSAANAAPSIQPSQSKPTTFCMGSHGKSFCVAQANTRLVRRAIEIGSDFEAGVVFTDEESDAAVQKFGCDCPACIRAIKQIRVFTSAA